MFAASTEAAFRGHINKSPHDWQALLVFSDFLADADDPRAEGYAVLGRLRRRPARRYYEYRGVYWSWSWNYLAVWEAIFSGRHRLADKTQGVNCLPEAWFMLVADEFPASPFEAVDRAAAVWPGVTEDCRLTTLALAAACASRFPHDTVCPPLQEDFTPDRRHKKG